MNRLSDILQRAPLERRTPRAWVCGTLALGISLGALSGCSGLLDVDLPADVTDAALNDPNAAETIRNSVIVEFEQAFNEFMWTLHGREDGGEILLASPGIDQVMNYIPTQMPFNGFHRSRKFGEDLHRNLTDVWEPGRVAQRNQLLAISSIYEGAALGILGSSMCESTIDGGPLMTPAETLALADARLTRALGEVEAAGDFAMPFGIASSARAMTYGLRAQVRWMAGNEAAAAADAAQVPDGFTAYVTREARPGRRNLAWAAGNGQFFARLLDVNDWWQGSQPNPVTGQAWPSIIPFTGFVNLGILPDGRAIRDDGLPIRTAGDYRTTVEDTAVPDTRVQAIRGNIVGFGGEGWVNAKYESEGDNLPLVNWKEMVLIRAEAAGGQGAIDLVNQIRAADNLPLVTYADPGNADEIRYMIIEERRRALFVEGRYYYTKLKNLDILWFPRGEGTLPASGARLFGGVRFIMPQSEYELNTNLSISDQATGCGPFERPIIDTG